MFYHLFRILSQSYSIPGAGMFQYISFRAAAAIIVSLLIAVIFGRSIIDFLRRQQIGEGSSRSAVLLRWAVSSSCWRFSYLRCCSDVWTTFMCS